MIYVGNFVEYKEGRAYIYPIRFIERTLVLDCALFYSGSFLHITVPHSADHHGLGDACEANKPKFLRTNMLKIQSRYLVGLSQKRPL